MKMDGVRGRNWNWGRNGRKDRRDKQGRGNGKGQLRSKATSGTVWKPKYSGSFLKARHM